VGLILSLGTHGGEKWRSVRCEVDIVGAERFELSTSRTRTVYVEGDAGERKVDTF
jgi:hypothetical protein